MRFSAPVATSALILSLALAACSSKTEPEPSPSANAGTQAIPQATPTPGATSDELADTTSIPPRLRGRWGLVPLDCTGDPAAAKGLIKVGLDTIEFYESMASLKSISDIGPYTIKGDFGFEGEGQSWDLQVALDSPDGGQTLIRTDTGEDAAPQPLTYRKCP